LKYPRIRPVHRAFTRRGVKVHERLRCGGRQVIGLKTQLWREWREILQRLPSFWTILLFG